MGKRILSIFCCVISIGLFGFIVANAISTEIRSRTRTAEVVSQLGDKPIELVLKYVFNNNIERAKEVFSQQNFYDSCSGDENLYHYFENFFNYINTKKDEKKTSVKSENIEKNLSEENFEKENPVKEEKKSLFDKAKSFAKEKKESIKDISKDISKNFTKEEKKTINDAIFFISASSNIEKYFSASGKSDLDAFKISEIIPYYVAKNYVQKMGNFSDIYLFTKEYKDLFTKFDSISKETADVICLHFYAEYKNSKDKKDLLKSELNEINAVKARYSNALGSNGTYASQKEYLSNVSKFLQRKENSLIEGHFTQLPKIFDRLENCPTYLF